MSHQELDAIDIRFLHQNLVVSDDSSSPFPISFLPKQYSTITNGTIMSEYKVLMEETDGSSILQWTVNVSHFSKQKVKSTHI